jgi:hypothetical protein
MMHVPFWQTSLISTRQKTLPHGSSTHAPSTHFCPGGHGSRQALTQAPERQNSSAWQVTPAHGLATQVVFRHTCSSGHPWP